VKGQSGYYTVPIKNANEFGARVIFQGQLDFFNHYNT
jgi:hypothetical protein